MTTEYCLRTDEFVDVIKTIDALEHFLYQVDEDLYFWKWCIIAMHSAVQGFMVCALRGSHGLNILNKQNTTKWLKMLNKKNEDYNNGRVNTEDYPKKYQDNFINLYHKTKDKEMDLYGSSRRFKPQKQQEKSIEEINEIRNEFIHYKTKIWSINIKPFPSMFLDCILYIEFLAFESNNILLEKAEEIELRTKINNIKNLLSILGEKYADLI